MTTTEPTTDESATTPLADTPAPVVQDTVTEPVTDDSAATLDTAQPEQLDPADSEQEPEQDGDEHDTDPRLTKARQEAKSLRSRLRDAEAEVGLSRATLGAMREDAAARLAAGHGGLADGGDLFKAGVQVGDLLAEDGTVDPAKVAEAVTGVLAERPHWGWQPAKAPGRPRETGAGWYDIVRDRKGQAAAQEMLKPGASGDPREAAASWADVLRT